MEHQVLMVGISLQLSEHLQTLFLKESIPSAYTSSIQEGTRLFAEKPCNLFILELPEENREIWPEMLAVLRKSSPAPIILLADEWDKKMRIKMRKDGSDMCLTTTVSLRPSAHKRWRCCAVTPCIITMIYPSWTPPFCTAANWSSTRSGTG